MPTKALWRLSPATFLLERIFFGLQYVSLVNIFFRTRIGHQGGMDTLQTDSEKSTATSNRGRVVEIYLAIWLCFELFLMFKASLATRLAWWLVVIPLWRILDILQTAININLFDRLRRGNRPHLVATLARTLILSIWNFIELMISFGIIYSVAIDKLKNAEHWYDAYYFSVVTQLTIGYGDICPTGWLKVIAASQGIFGFLFGLIVLSRLVAFLPKLQPVYDDN